MPFSTSLMPARLILRLAAGFCALGLAVAPAAAIANPLDWLFGKTSSEKPAQPAAPEPTPPARRAPAARTAQPGPQKPVLPPKRPASLATEQSEAAPAVQLAGAPAPTPAAPRQAAPHPGAPPVVTAAAAVAPPTSSEPLTERQIVERANAYFNGISTLVGDFVQTGGDGRRLTGKLYLQRPGKIRFEYDSPATIEVIADGNSVAVRDRKLVTQDLYSIAQTPLKFLLRDHINLGQDIRITGASLEPEGVRVALEDKSTLGGTSRITLFFDKDVQALKRWRIVDPQGFTTIVELTNLETGRRVDPRLFVINYERLLDPK
jgi:outer membrane lipoprotein-sorting protein